MTLENAYSMASVSTGVTDHDLTISVSSNSDRILGVVILERGNASSLITGVTYDPAGANQALTQRTVANNGSIHIHVWYLTNPTSGTSKTLRVTTSATAVYIHTAAYDLSGMDTTNITDGYTTATGTSTQPSVTFTTSAADGQFVCYGAASEANSNVGIDTWTGVTGQTTSYDSDEGSWIAHSARAIQTTAGSITMSSQTTQSDTWAAAGACFASAVSGDQSISVTDTGAGTDATPGISVSAAISDAGAGAETFPISASVPVTDSGSAADIIAQLLKQTFINVADSGSAVDSVTQIIASILASESATGTDAISQILSSLSVSDSGAGADAISQLLASLSVSDSGTGTTGTPSVQQATGTTAPTLVNAYQTNWTTSAVESKTVVSNLSLSTGDVVVIITCSADTPWTASLTENGSASAVLQYSQVGSAPIYIWTYTATTSESVTFTVNQTGDWRVFGAVGYHYTDTDGIGNKASAENATGAPTVEFTTAGDNSAIVMLTSDWDADGGTQTADTSDLSPFTAEVEVHVASIYDVFSGTYDDTGDALPINLTELTSGSVSNDFEATTASISPTYTPVIIVVDQAFNVGTSGGPATVSGCGLTWTSIGSVVYQLRRRITILQGTGTPTSGQLTISNSEASRNSTYEGVAYAVFESPNIQSIGTFSSNSGTSGTTASMTLSGSPTGNDVSFAAVGIENSYDPSWEAGWDELVDEPETSNVRRLTVAWDSDKDTTPSASWSTSAGWGIAGFYIVAQTKTVGQTSPTNFDWGLVAIEVKGQASAGTVKTVTDSGAGADGTPSISAAGTVSETGSAADTVAQILASLSVSDSGSGADIVSQILVSLAISDSGSGADIVAQILYGIYILDSGAGTDVITQVLTALSVLDAATGSDAVAQILASLLVSDTAAGSEVINVITATLVSITDSGAGADSVAQILASLLISETASGADTVAQILASLLISDTTSGADVISALASLVIPEVGAGTDSISQVLATLSIADATTGTDSVAQVLATLLLSEAGAGTDAVNQILASLSVADSGTGTDAPTVITDIVKSIFEVASGVDSLAVTASVSVTDLGAGNEAQQISVSLQVVDSGSAAEVINVITAALIQIAESAAGSDQITISVNPLLVSDIGTGTENFAVTVSFSVADSGAGTDVVNLIQTAYVLVTEIATAVDQISQVSVYVPILDLGTAMDAIAGISASLSVAESATGIDAIIAFDVDQQVARITFVVNPYTIVFLLQNYNITFSLQNYDIAFS